VIICASVGAHLRKRYPKSELISLGQANQNNGLLVALKSPFIQVSKQFETKGILWQSHMIMKATWIYPGALACLMPTEFE